MRGIARVGTDMENKVKWALIIYKENSACYYLKVLSGSRQRLFSFALYLDGKHFGEPFFDTVVFIFSGISVCPATTAMRL